RTPGAGAKRLVAAGYRAPGKYAHAAGGKAGCPGRSADAAGTGAGRTAATGSNAPRGAGAGAEGSRHAGAAGSTIGGAETVAGKCADRRQGATLAGQARAG